MMRQLRLRWAQEALADQRWEQGRYRRLLRPSEIAANERRIARLERKVARLAAGVGGLSAEGGQTR